MSLDIEDEETIRLVRELAALTGEDQEDAVETAVRERLERLRRERQGVAGQIMQLAAGTAPLFKEPYVDHGDLLYDEIGLPK